MNIPLLNVQYHPNGSSVALLLGHPIAPLLRTTTQAALTARTAGGTGVWSDGEALAEAQAILDAEFAGQGLVAVLPEAPSS